MKNKRLYLVWTDKNGERYWSAEERIRVIDPATGNVKIQRRWQSLGVKGKDKRRTAERVLRDMEADLEHSAGSRAAVTISVRQFVEDYLAAARPSIRPRTLESYSSWLSKFAQRHGLLRLTDIDHRFIEEWKVVLSTTYAPTSVNIALRALKTALGYAVKHGLLDRSPMNGVKMAKVPSRTFPAFISMEQFKTVVLPGVKDQRRRVAFCLAMFAGLRRQEAANLRWRDIDFDRAEIRIESTETFETKSGKGRVLPLYDSLRRELEALPKTGEYVLQGRGGLPDAGAIGRAWLRTTRALRAAGHDLPPIPYHGLRHSFATWLATDVGLNLKALQALLGHADIQTTMLYAHVQPQLAVEQAKRIML